MLDLAPTKYKCNVSSDGGFTVELKDPQESFERETE